MNKIFLIFILLFSTLVYSSQSYAAWTKIVKGAQDGATYYVDFDRIRKHSGYIYFWVLKDYLKPDKYGDFSVKAYTQADCKLFKNKTLKLTFYTQPMGKGTVSDSGNP